MPKKSYEWDTQKKVGDKGETLFLQYYPNYKKGDGFIADFLLGEQKIELKTDTWSMEDTENFFMEYISDIKRGNPGGPFRAREEGVDVYVYFYIKNKTFYWFDVVSLTDFLYEYIKDKKYKTVKNKAWITSGYTVPRSTIEHLAIRVDDFSDPF